MKAKYAKIASLRNPLQKMSKSSPDPDSKIFLTDEPDQIKSRLKSAVTDTDRSIEYAPESRPGISNLITMWAGLANVTPQKVVSDFQSQEGKQAGHAIFKKRLAQIIVDHCEPIRERYTLLMNQPQRLDDLSMHMTDIARKRAEDTMQVVRDAVGLR